MSKVFIKGDYISFCATDKFTYTIRVPKIIGNIGDTDAFKSAQGLLFHLKEKRWFTQSMQNDFIKLVGEKING